MTRILKDWPGADNLFSSATKCSGISFKRAENSERVGFMKFYAEIMSDLEADFLVFQYADFIRYLTQLCVDAGVVIKYGCEAVGISTADGIATVSLKDGNALSADIVIGADGHNSLVRAILEDNPDAEELKVIHTVTGVNISVPTKVFREHEDLESLCTGNETTIWAGNGSSLIGTLDLNAETSYFSLCSPTRLDVDISEWYAGSGANKPLPFDLSGYDPRLQKLIGLGSSCFPTVQDISDLDETVGLHETTVLVGDAAHCASIHGSHNAAMGVEDAATIGRLFACLSERSQIRPFLHAYHEIRKPRTEATQTSEFAALVQICLPPGDLKVARDMVYQATLNPDFEEFTKCADSDEAVAAWEEYLTMFSYNATDQVANYRTLWPHALDSAGETVD
ncbi:hypothetical protein DFH06DRAFT_292525 [Mycena polygramma]|nr:hypothetical protein DFH06DRAFT_292525 [Mycena polygramma]